MEFPIFFAADDQDLAAADAWFEFCYLYGDVPQQQSLNTVGRVRTQAHRIKDTQSRISSSELCGPCVYIINTNTICNPSV
jgi:hypothetical protein